ncbi:PQQ-dependent sugar dehydrogenase [Leptospira santarosai]|uniref:Glucose/sorbosone dehydrogenase n=2 Tax=Leptospira santarosai TaxID=28183 RepID=M6V4M1_9LEPT|nr:PQQ-dependent sugar dehydrogenase [Leptospira santarosai]EKS07465.1 glucose/sorbosone dehydrogenase [Leptospira santarosai str. JET]EMF90334.1 glucose/sorbosone dehydrogenase [Leptospira santarosai str. ST188]EMM84693.1 glucose/sorbosone dehydrogenase [Leptospira santarosai str. 2000027870]EMN23552.1 glucose/sorbosone dehydrogenase [Leptospira santarosai serovar Arenal str. MAVJ 401]EMO15201.1 glucose/sorbosone dehydrogenase [Leptospira santarosai str. CBC523]
MFFTIEFSFFRFIKIKLNTVRISKSILNFLRSENVFPRIRNVSVCIFFCGVFVSTNGCERVQNILVEILGASDKYKAEGNTNLLRPLYSGKDETREKISISLKEVSAGFQQPTDIQFPPGETGIFLVTEQKGKLRWGKVRKNEIGTLLTLNVLSESEQGLLGLAFHPDFIKNGKLYLNYVLKVNGKDTSRVSEWIVSSPKDLTNSKITSERIIMEVVQPYPNHNAGQLAFGPDRYLYVGWGDGGWMGDPKKNGQNPKTFLGSMLRIDVNSTENGKGYKVPEDNPFVKDPCCVPETFAYGFRNPWRYSFDPKGRLILADVGQDLWEEVNIVERGKNYGWDVKEASHCFNPKQNCKQEGLTDPIYEYGREEGQSITGGYVYSNSEISDLNGKYVFADFVSGRIWALELPEQSGQPAKKVYSLGKWPMLVSSFGRDSAGKVYLSDFGSGKIYRIDPR